ncbi:hypothetical protein GCM10027425_06800 [Alteromonas gracilis]
MGRGDVRRVEAAVPHPDRPGEGRHLAQVPGGRAAQHAAGHVGAQRGQPAHGGDVEGLQHHVGPHDAVGDRLDQAGRGVGVLELDQERGEVERVGQRRDAESGEVVAVQIRDAPRGRSRPAYGGVGALERRVVQEHGHAVAGEADVDLDPVGAETAGERDRGEGVLGGVATGATVGDGEHAATLTSADERAVTRGSMRPQQGPKTPALTGPLSPARSHQPRLTNPGCPARP